ncbi:SsrA-binding protein [Alphaproteobacteria bacterium]|nr:SsrA-binding protein [Alphaproteobacteria bacterium]
MKPRSKTLETGTIAVNRKARFAYAVEETLEVGLVLFGPEVKSLRQGRASIAESYASVEGGELWLVGATIEEYGSRGYASVEPRRKRKLLASKSQVKKLAGSVARQGYTLIPLSLYFNSRGLAKLSLGLAKGKNQRDKRADVAARDWAREKSRVLRRGKAG